MRYQAYPDYKDSGIEWIGEIPADWVVSRVKYHCAVKGRIGFRGYTKDDLVKEGEGALVIGASEIGSNGNIQLNDPQFITWDKYYESPEIMLQGGMVLVVQRGSVGKVAEVPHKLDVATINPSLIVLRDLSINSRYLTYSLQCTAIQSLVSMQTSSTAVPMISQEQVGEYWQLVPSLQLQQFIASFLDHETAKIDTLIEKQQQLIALLKEKRQAVISHAVTKGLNPDAPMRDSGVEWLGEVPAHWTVSKSKYLFDFITSGSRGWASFYSDEGALFFRIANLTRNTINPKLESIQKVSPPHGSEGERAVIKVNDLLISITADLGSICVADESIAGGYVSQHVSLCRPSESVASARWLAYYILSDVSKEQLLGAGYGGTKIQLSLEDIRDLWIARPPADEQIFLSKFIDRQMEKFRNLINKTEIQINLLQERRTALISAAVTGKVDVRNWQSPTDKDIL